MIDKASRSEMLSFLDNVRFDMDFLLIVKCFQYEQIVSMIIFLHKAYFYSLCSVKAFDMLVSRNCNT